MDDVFYYCPVCGGNVLFEDMSNPRAAQPSELTEPRKLYCPHCEMLVEPVVTSAEQWQEQRAAAPPGANDRGRSRANGSNAGGSQRGDLSDEGATQWRRDPLESERNTWDDKP